MTMRTKQQRCSLGAAASGWAACCLALICVPAALAPAAADADSTWQSYLQLRYTSPADGPSYLSLRRLKLIRQGPAGGCWSYYVQALYKANNQSATDDRVYLQEANAALRLTRSQVTLGQFKPPFGLERFTSDTVLPLIDRSQVTDHLVPNGNLGESFDRARGAQWESGKAGQARLALSVFEGNGANNAFAGNGPLLAARVSLPERRAGGVHYGGQAAVSWRRDRDADFHFQLPGAPSGYRSFAGSDARWDLALTADASPTAVRAEYLAANYRSDESGVPSLTADGYYLQVAHTWSARWGGAIRYEEFHPGTADGAQDLAWTTLGVSRFFARDRRKVQVNYVIKREGAAETRGNALLVQYQQFF